MRLVLEIVSSAYGENRLILERGEVATVGRTDKADFRVSNDPTMSKMHFRLECTGAYCEVRDLESFNGTFLNGARVTKGLLRDGDELIAGQTKFRVRIDVEPPAVAAPSPISASPVHGSLRFDQAPLLKTPLSDGPLHVETGSLSSPLPTRTEPPSPDPTAAGVPNLPRPYARALADEDSGVRREALLAAAWARQPWVLEYCRKLAHRPSADSWDAILLLAVLGQPSHLQTMLALAKVSALGPKRFRALGAYGHPGTLTILLEAIEGKDPLAAVSAGSAFTKITGADIGSDVVYAPEPGGDGDPKPDVPDGIILPSTKLAREYWAQVKAKLTKGTRWCRGFDLSKDVTEDVLAQLDLESRWEASLRGRFYGTWRGSLIDLERFPQKRR